jgi:phytoene dehydrogenase-like protein
MSTTYQYDAVVVGAGPNGLAAAITIARTGRSVIVFEAKETIGGGSRSMELTLPGFVHDVCSAIHPLGLGSTFFRTLPLEQYGLDWIHPSAPLAHPLDDGTVAILERSIEATRATLGRDAQAYTKLMAPLVARWERVADAFLGPLRLQPLFAEPFSLASFGLKALCSARGLAESRFKGEAARAMFAGLCAHSMLPFERATSAAAGLVLGTLGHAIGWPLPRGGMPLSTGVFVLYSDDESFTLMTPQGHVFAGWITFSAHEEIGCTVAQAQVLMRANDPIYELGLRFGGHKQEDVF